MKTATPFNEIASRMSLLSKGAGKVTIIQHGLMSRIFKVTNCNLRECEDGMFVAISGENEVRFWIEDIYLINQRNEIRLRCSTLS